MIPDLDEGGIYLVDLRFPDGGESSYRHYVVAMASTTDTFVPVPVYVFHSKVNKNGVTKNIDPVACLELTGSEYSFLDRATVVDARAPLYIRLDMQSKWDSFQRCPAMSVDHLNHLRMRIMYANGIPAE
ncbi:MAG: hypothetical protein H7123_01250 [Thermoleophilia bacterium]|nr:hypothetical protein [Thermoleophilia bacterium]